MRCWWGHDKGQGSCVGVQSLWGENNGSRGGGRERTHPSHIISISLVFYVSATPASLCMTRSPHASHTHPRTDVGGKRNSRYEFQNDREKRCKMSDELVKGRQYCCVGVATRQHEWGGRILESVSINMDNKLHTWQPRSHYLRFKPF